MDRRTTIKWILAASASMPLLEQRLDATPAQPAASQAVARGFGTDPDLTKTYHPGDLWPLTFSAEQHRTAAALCDVIIPADGRSPAASAIGVVEFLDEWISAPYLRQRQDRPLLLNGLAWLNAESTRRFSKKFTDLKEAQQHAICDDICLESKATPSLAAAAKFFTRYRDLTVGGFYSTPTGHKDVEYVGNVPLATFAGPPPELLRKLGLAEEPVPRQSSPKQS